MERVNDFFDEINSVQIIGDTKKEFKESSSESTMDKFSLSLNFGADTSSRLDAGGQASVESDFSSTREWSGQEIYRVNFGGIGRALKAVVDQFPKRELWIFIDEWSEVPMALQPILADMLRRAVMPISGVIVKIAAIEHRSKFSVYRKDHGVVGLELGADIASMINLDDLMVFDNDSNAVNFYKTLFFNHLRVDDFLVSGSDLMTKSAFTQINAFQELVRACEGVPRDAIYILGMAAQRAANEKISVLDVRSAAQSWYQTGKATTASANDMAMKLLAWIVDVVINGRRAKAFLINSSVRDDLIEYLFDARILHVLKKGMSALDHPGERFIVYGIDYGCYVDLINTVKSPQGLLDLGIDAPDFSDDVPQTDFRSIRRCVLYIEDFYKKIQL